MTASILKILVLYYFRLFRFCQMFLQFFYIFPRPQRLRPCLEVSTMFLLKRLYQNIQMCAYLSHFFYAKNYFNFFVFMI